LQAEKERRARITEEIVRKEREEREARKREQEKEATEENERRERCVACVREEIRSRGAVDLVEEAWKEGKDRVWLERLIRASGLLQQLQMDGERVMITGDGWLVKIDQNIMARAYAEAEAYGNAHDGRVSFDDLGGFIENAVLARAKA
jgi:DNA helicase IV